MAQLPAHAPSVPDHCEPIVKRVYAGAIRSAAFILDGFQRAGITIARDVVFAMERFSFQPDTGYAHGTQNVVANTNAENLPSENVVIRMA